MDTEAQRQADQVIDVFGEAYMKLIRERLRLRVNTMTSSNHKIQFQIELIDQGNEAQGVPVRLIDSAIVVIEQNLTLMNDLKIRPFQ